MVSTIGVVGVVGKIPVDCLGISIGGNIDATIHLLSDFSVGDTIAIAMLFAFVLMSFWVKH